MCGSVIQQFSVKHKSLLLRRFNSLSIYGARILEHEMLTLMNLTAQLVLE